MVVYEAERSPVNNFSSLLLLRSETHPDLFDKQDLIIVVQQGPWTRAATELIWMMLSCTENHFVIVLYKIATV
jgi:hypothetical protein